MQYACQASYRNGIAMIMYVKLFIDSSQVSLYCVF